MASVAPTEAFGWLEAPRDPQPIAWVLHDGKAGMTSQALGLAEATGLPFIEKRLAIRHPWVWLPPQLWLLPFRAAGDTGASLRPPRPELVIACGRNAAMPALAIRRAGGGHTVAAQIQNPGVGRAEFDMLVIPEHDRLRAPRVIVTRGAVHRVTQARLAAECHRFPTLATMPRRNQQNLSADGPARRRDCRGAHWYPAPPWRSVLVSPSRRTAEAGLAPLRERLEGFSTAIWDGSGENPYFAYLALADEFLVTADSISMINEATATGKPVHVLDLDGGNAKFARFHETMQAAGITRPFSGHIESWSYSIPDDTARAGAALRALVLGRRQRA